MAELRTHLTDLLDRISACFDKWANLHEAQRHALQQMDDDLCELNKP